MKKRLAKRGVGRILKRYVTSFVMMLDSKCKPKSSTHQALEKTKSKGLIVLKGLKRKDKGRFDEQKEGHHHSPKRHVSLQSVGAYTPILTIRRTTTTERTYN